jgi:hypothetical protein
MRQAAPHFNDRSEYQNALQALYLEFAVHPFRSGMPCCIPHCMDQAELDVLGQKPLREITAEELRPFAANLLSTCGEVEDFKFALPRLFECSSQYLFAYPDPELMFGHLHQAEWRSWPPGERRAVEDFLNAWWKLELQRTADKHEDAWHLEECFASLCCTGLNPHGWLVLWRERAPLALAEFINEHIAQFWSGKSFNSWIEHQKVNVVPSIRDFLREAETGLALERAFHASQILEDQDVLSLAEGYLQTTWNEDGA